MNVPLPDKPLQLAPDPVPELRLWDLPQWPVTRLAATTLTAALWAAIVLPAFVFDGFGPDVALLLLPAALATAVGRVLFEALLPGRRRQLRGQMVPALGGALPATLVVTVAAVVVGLHWPPGAIATTAALSWVALLTAGVSRDFEIRWRMRMRRVYFAGAPDARTDLERELARRSDASFVGASVLSKPVDSQRLLSAVQAAAATALVLDHDAMAAPELVEAAMTLRASGVLVLDLVSYYESEFKKVPLAELSPTWFLFDVARGRRHQRIMRRVVEAGGSALLLLLSTPVLLVCWLAVRLTSSGPGLYRQQRVGKDGVPFTMLKLRTMTGTDSGAATWAGAEAHRLTPVGRVLRRFRLDELPQLVNVLRGDLALVGPRPEQVPIVERLEKEIPFYGARHSVRPGLTGWAQVNLGYGGTVEGMLAKLQRDLYYVKHAGWRLDCLILWLTLKAIVLGPDN